MLHCMPCVRYVGECQSYSCGLSLPHIYKGAVGMSWVVALELICTPPYISVERVSAADMDDFSMQDH